MKSIALAALASSVAVATPASAGVYANVESNGARVGSEYTGRTVDHHIGYEGNAGKLGYYIQGGPAISAEPDVAGTERTLSGKLGGKFNVTQRLGVYGEISGTSNDDADNTYGTKIGAKYSF